MEEPDHHHILPYGKAVNGQTPRFEIVLRRKLLPAWLLSKARPYRGGLTREVTLENWVDTIIDTINVLKTHDNELSAICKASSHMDESGKTILKYPSWKNRGRILSIKKELPPVQVFHAKKEEQTYLDNAPGIHGSNGTYVENANPFWSLNIQIQRASFEVTDPIWTNIDVHEYITKSLMPKLGWGRITQDRLDLLNKILSGTVMELETSDTNEAALYRKFLPIGYTSWDDYLDALIIPRIQQ